MFVWLVRHAIAEELPHGAHPADDLYRELTRKGRKRFAALAARLKSTPCIPDQIVSSPLVRAAQTAEILRDELGLNAKQVHLDERLACGMLTLELTAVISAHAKTDRLAIVGHEPDLSRSLCDLIGGGRVKFAKGAVACLELEPESPLLTARLHWFATTDLA
jgi:phosphohistidine phosphatase